jgi:outer membrane biosynthesis protein TonB
MPKSEAGEFELILGNKQLLSVFFIVVVLLGLFFTMGFIVGRNSSPGAVELARGKEGRPLVVDSPNAPPATKISPADAPPSEVPKETPPAAEPAKETAKEPVKETPKETKETPKETPKEVAKKEPERPKEKREEPKAEAAPAGSYLQIAAVPGAEADSLIRVLGTKGFRGVKQPAPNKDNIYRVLVAVTGDVASFRAKLDEAGFPGAKGILRKF